MAELILPIGAIQLAITSGYINLSGWCLAFILFTVIPIVEHIIGIDSTHTINDLKESPEKYSYYSILTFLCVPSVIVLSLYSALFFSDTPGLNWIGRIGWMITIGISIAALALCAAHELIHRKALLERLVGGFLLAFVCHSDFMVVHIRGHHAKVATPSDSSSARIGQSLYHFLLQSYRYTTAHAWVLEKEKLNRRGYSAFSWRNELIWWNALSIVLGTTYYFYFGPLGLVFFVGQGFVAITAHHIINYFQHYGLRRCKLENGKYEKFTPKHAWGSNFLFSDVLTFHLPRHADHHLNPRCRYQGLRHCDESPQMPLGYLGMFLLSMIPSLWFKVMNSRVLEHQKEHSAKHDQIEYGDGNPSFHPGSESRL